MTVRALSRGLTILQRLTTIDGLSANDLARQLGLPRGTTHRLLRTLESDGYVHLSPSDGRWRTTHLTRALGQGEDWEAWVSQAASPRILAFTKAHLWPLVVSTLYGVHMIVRASSDHASPFALQRYRRGFLITLTGASAGRVFLAYCTPAVRAALCDLLRDQELPRTSQRFLANIEEEAAQIRALGYATSPLVFQGEAAIATPIFDGEKVVGALSLRYIASAKRASDMAASFLCAMQDITEAIETEMRRAETPDANR